MESVTIERELKFRESLSSINVDTVTGADDSDVMDQDNAVEWANWMLRTSHPKKIFVDSQYNENPHKVYHLYYVYTFANIILSEVRNNFNFIYHGNRKNLIVSLDHSVIELDRDIISDLLYNVVPRMNQFLDYLQTKIIEQEQLEMCREWYVTTKESLQTTSVFAKIWPAVKHEVKMEGWTWEK